MCEVCSFRPCQHRPRCLIPICGDCRAVGMSFVCDLPAEPGWLEPRIDTIYCEITKELVQKFPIPEQFIPDAIRDMFTHPKEAKTAADNRRREMGEAPFADIPYDPADYAKLPLGHRDEPNVLRSRSGVGPGGPMRGRAVAALFSPRPGDLCDENPPRCAGCGEVTETLQYCPSKCIESTNALCKDCYADHWCTPPTPPDAQVDLSHHISNKSKKPLRPPTLPSSGSSDDGPPGGGGRVQAQRTCGPQQALPSVPEKSLPELFDIGLEEDRPMRGDTESMKDYIDFSSEYFHVIANSGGSRSDAPRFRDDSFVADDRNLRPPSSLGSDGSGSRDGLVDPGAVPPPVDPDDVSLPSATRQRLACSSLSA